MLKYAWSVLIALLFISASVSAQHSRDDAAVEKVIRELEKLQVEAILHRDMDTLDALFADELIVSAPSNQLVNKPVVLQLIRDRKISYSAFKAEIDTIMIRGDIVITNGRETVKPIDDAPFAGTIVQRRYSQVWKRSEGSYQLVFRHANIVCSK